MDSLDLESLGFKHFVSAPAGRPAYNPYDLAKLYLIPANRIILS